MKIKVLCLLLTIFISCKEDNNDINVTPPELTASIIDLGTSYNVNTGFIGDVHEFSAFGEILNQGLANEHISPTIEYYTKPDAVVKSCLSGTVLTVDFQVGDNSNEEDYEIHITPNSNSAWLIIIDHVKSPKVKVGDKVNVGDVLGNVGYWYPHLGVVELQINKKLGNQTVMVCPSQVFSSNIIAAHQNMANELKNQGVIGSAVLCLTDEIESN